MVIGSTIRKLREQHNLKQINLANALQVSPQAVSKWEKGASLPDIETLVKISRLFNVSMDFLLGLTSPERGIFIGTVLCSSLRGFARMSNALDSRAIADYTNTLFYNLTEATLKYHGIPIKYVGDGYLCLFSGPNHEDRAVCAALHAKKVIRQKELIISINTGSVYLGLIGHPKYAMTDIVGKTVNIAFLTIGWAIKNTPAHIVITSDVIKNLKGDYNKRLYNNIRLEFIEDSIDLYEIITEDG
ncbi:MAG: helix-turn-helix domain-containing protein [Syntrophorhabdaceae bacterium]|nr:helix-turn-helix domain-containing protein [Syntrophorhabdales bacterium]MBP9561509.1 helix-turn-helix domain-containing protein [Syntrophorhabdaceae bacterium]